MTLITTFEYQPSLDLADFAQPSYISCFNQVSPLIVIIKYPPWLKCFDDFDQTKFK